MRARSAQRSLKIVTPAGKMIKEQHHALPASKDFTSMMKENAFNALDIAWNAMHMGALLAKINFLFRELYAWNAKL